MSFFDSLENGQGPKILKDTIYSTNIQQRGQIVCFDYRGITLLRDHERSTLESWNADVAQPDTIRTVRL